MEDKQDSQNDWDWSTRHVRLRFELFLISLLILLISVFDAQFQSPAWLPIKFAGTSILEKTILTALFFVYLYFLLAIVIRTQSEIRKNSFATERLNKLFHDSKLSFPKISDSIASSISPDFKKLELALKQLDYDNSPSDEVISDLAEIWKDSFKTHHHDFAKTKKYFEENIEIFTDRVTDIFLKNLPNYIENKNDIVTEIKLEIQMAADSQLRLVDSSTHYNDPKIFDTLLTRLNGISEEISKNTNTIEATKKEFLAVIDSSKSSFEEHVNNELEIIDSKIGEINQNFSDATKFLEDFKNTNYLDRYGISLIVPIFTSISFIWFSKYKLWESITYSSCAFFELVKKSPVELLIVALLFLTYLIYRKLTSSSDS